MSNPDGTPARPPRDAISKGRVTVTHVVLRLDVGGLERMVISLLESMDRRRFRPVLVCLHDRGRLLDTMRCDDVPVHVLNAPAGLRAMTLLGLARVARAERSAVLHAHNTGPLAYASIVGRVTRTPVVYTAHGRLSARRIGKPLYRAGRIDRTVAVSADAEREALAAGLRKARVSMIANGVDTTRFDRRPDRSAIRAGLGISDDAWVFTIVARLTAVKDHRMLFDAFDRVAAAHPNARLLVVGDGELTDDLTATRGAMTHRDAVVMTGNRSDVEDILGAADVFVLSSYSEGLSITLLEAMSAGLPVVATDVGGNPEAVVHGDTGLIVPVRDAAAMAEAMNQVAADPFAARRMGSRGAERARSRFGVASMTRAYEALYEALSGAESE